MSVPLQSFEEKREQYINRLRFNAPSMQTGQLPEGTEPSPQRIAESQLLEIMRGWRKPVNFTSVLEIEDSNGFFVGNEIVNMIGRMRPVDLLMTEIIRMAQRGIMDWSAYGILASDPELGYHIGEVFDALMREMPDLGINGECRIGTFSDPESMRGPMLVLECRVKNMPYQELIEIWKRLSLKLFQSTPKEYRKRIAFVMGPA